MRFRSQANSGGGFRGPRASRASVTPRVLSLPWWPDDNNLGGAQAWHRRWYPVVNGLAAAGALAETDDPSGVAALTVFFVRTSLEKLPSVEELGQYVPPLVTNIVDIHGLPVGGQPAAGAQIADQVPVQG